MWPQHTRTWASQITFLLCFLLYTYIPWKTWHYLTNDVYRPLEYNQGIKFLFR